MSRKAFEEWVRTPPPENWWDVSESGRIRMTWQAATAAALERAAKVCEKLGTATNGIYERNQECAEAIRALKDAE